MEIQTQAGAKPKVRLPSESQFLMFSAVFSVFFPLLAAIVTGRGKGLKNFWLRLGAVVLVYALGVAFMILCLPKVNPGGAGAIASVPTAMVWAFLLKLWKMESKKDVEIIPFSPKVTAGAVLAIAAVIALVVLPNMGRVQKDCEIKGEVRACITLGRDRKHTEDYFTGKADACKAGIRPSCMILGGRAMGQKDYTSAAEYFAQSCNKDYSESCVVLAEMLFAKKSTGDVLAAFGVLQEACKIYGQEIACKELTAARGNFEGDWKAKLQVKCDALQVDACAFIGAIYYAIQDYPAAKPELLKACNLGSGYACMRAGHIAYTEKKIPEALELSVKGCNYKDADACYNAACESSLLGKKKDAVAYLKQMSAISKTFTAEKIQSDADFANMKGDPAFQAFLKTLPQS